MQKAVSRFQDLPTDVLLLIFDQLDLQHLAPLSTTCRSLKNVLSVHLRYHSSIHLTNNEDDARKHAGQLISDIITIFCKHKSIALSIRKVSISITEVSSTSCGILSEEICNQIKHALRVIPELRYPWTVVSPGSDYESWLLFVLLMCRNLESISLETKYVLKWHRTAQCLQYLHWPNERLKHVNILSKTSQAESYNGTHDLQDLWLLFSAPSLESLRINGLRQNNNLYSGGIDRAAIRTIYWPIELEIPSLYHHTYRGQSHHGREPPADRPLNIPTPPTRQPITHGFQNLHKLSLRRSKLPESWYPILLPCFKSLKYLTLTIGLSTPIALGVSYIQDLRLISLALLRLSNTLETLILDVQTPRRSIDWINAARCGFISLGSLHGMHQLRSATMPWFSWLPNERVNADPYDSLGECHIRLPPRLERLALSRCELAAPGVITELVTATLVARDRIDHCDGGNSDSIGGGGGVLRSVVLQADIELVLREADFVKLAQGNKGAGNDNGNGGDEVEVSLEKVMVSEEGFVVYDSD